MKQFSCILAVLFCLVFVGCSSDNDGTENTVYQLRQEIALSRSQQDIVDSQTRFAFDFFKAASKYSALDNLAISPLSLSLDLAMLANGAGEQTYNDIMEAMHTSGVTSDEFNALYNTLVSGLLNADPDIDFTLANSMWCDNEFGIREGFAKNIFDNYDANIEALDFKNSDNVKAIVNRWTTEKTKGKITDIFDAKDDLSNSKFLLCNAMYFDGKWNSPFDNNETKAYPFTNIDNSESNVMTMHREGSMGYASDEVADIVRLSYGNCAFSMYIIFPDLDENVHSQLQLMNQFVENLNYDWWQKMRVRTMDQMMELYLPKFKIETKYSNIGTSFFAELRDVVFLPDLSLMTDEEIPVIKIDQFNSIDVSEGGTVAASVTKSNGASTFCPPNGTLEINRPFIYLIEEFSTGAILFMGKVTKLGEE